MNDNQSEGSKNESDEEHEEEAMEIESGSSENS